MARQPAFVITIDTEADNEWEAGRVPSYENIASLPDLQALCEGYGAKPTYLVTHAVAIWPECAGILQAVSDGGTHLNR